MVFKSVAKFCSTWRTVSSKSQSLFICILLAFSMFIYLTPVAPKYRLKFIAATAIVFSEPVHIVSASSNSGIYGSGRVSPVCCLLVPCPVSYGFCRFRILSNTMWNSIFRSISSCVSLFIPSKHHHKNLFFATTRFRFSFVLLSAF